MSAIGHNSATAGFEGLCATLDALSDDAVRWAKDTPDDVTAPLVRDAIQAAAELSKRADLQRELEKRPHLEAGRAIDAKYRPVIDGSQDIAKALKGALQRYIDAEKRRLVEIAEAARKAAEEEERKAREAAEAAKPDDPFEAFDAEQAAEAAAEAQRRAAEAQAQAASKVRVGGFESGARALGTRTTYDITVVNAEALVAHFATHPGIVEECRKLALAQVRAGKGFAAIPGIEITKAERVA